MKKEFLKIGIIFFVTIAVVLWGLNFIFLNKNAPKSKATGETITLSFNPPSVTPAANEFTVSLIAIPPSNTTTLVRGYKTKVDFDKAILQLTDIQYKGGVVSAGLGNTNTDLERINSYGNILIVAESTASTGLQLPSPNGVELVTLKFKAVTAAPTVVSIGTSEFYSIASDATLSNTWMYAASSLSVNGGGPTGGPVPICESFSDDFSGIPSTNNFSDDFSGSNLNNNYWDTFTDGQGNVTVSNGELSLSQPTATVQQYTRINQKNINVVTGDFTVEETLKSITTNAPGNVDGSVELSATNWVGTGDFIRVSRYSGSNAIVIWNKVGSADAVSASTGDIGITPTSSYKVKIERIGNKANIYYDLLGGQGYKLFKTWDNVYMGPVTFETFIIGFGPNFPLVTAKIDDFKLTHGPQLDASKWAWIPPATSSSSAVLSNGKLVETILPVAGRNQYVSLSVGSKLISGDFEAVGDLQVDQAGSGGGGGPAMIFTSDGWINQLNVTLNINGDLSANTSMNNQWSTEQFVKSGLTQPVTVKINRTGDTVKFYYKNGSEFILLGERSGIYTGGGYLNFHTNSTAPDYPAITSSFDNFALTCPVMPLPITSVTQSPTGGPGNNEVKLNVKLKFQGIGSKPPTDALNSMLVKFTLYDETTGQNADYDIAKVTSDEKGIWSGMSDLTVNTSHKFALLVKGPYHVQKKVCDMVPTETAGGTYRCSDGKITLSPGVNDLDLSGILLLVGDLPEQNGTVDAYDISLVRNCLTATGDDKTNCLIVADVNRDGKVDTQDYSLIIASLSVKSDEE